MLDTNPFSSGIAPRRTYLTGLLMNEGATNTAIGVWRSDNGGLSWTGSVIVATSSDYYRPVDKPDIVVSWYTGTRGHVYVAYVKLAPSGNTHYLYVARSTNGGQTFGAPVLVTATNNSINGAQVLVNYHYGYVYVLWTDFSLNALRMSSSYDYGQTWTSPEIAAHATVKMLGGGQSDHIYGGTRGIRAGSLPMARFNWVANRISVVWHEKEPGSTTPPKTDVYYTSKSPSGWQSKVRITDVQTNDQFMPGIDFDTSGNMIVTFFDRREDPNNLFYHEYMARINPTGTRLEPNKRVSTFQSDPRAYPYYSTYIFMGDYQDNWDWTSLLGEYYISSWVGIPSVGDIYISVIQP
ncbi:MAG: sialidase family protein [Nitrospirota bacterium]